jgi:hypothetical protein
VAASYSDDAFRQAARRLHPTLSVESHAVVENVEGGAFVEAKIFVCDAAAKLGEVDVAELRAREETERTARAAKYAPKEPS